MTGPRVDTNYYLVLEIRAQDQLYEYYYNTKRDTLEFVMWQDKKRTSILVDVDNKFRTFLIDEVINGLNNIKVDDKHNPVRHSFSVFCVIVHNHSQKQIEIRDKFYLDQVKTIFNNLNSKLPVNARFEDNFDFSEFNSNFLGNDTTIAVDLDHSANGDHKQDKFIFGAINKKEPLKLSYHDDAENKRVYKHPVILDPRTLNTLRLKSLDYVNTFTIQGPKFTKTTDTLEVFGVEYSVPGIYMNAKITSLEKMRHSKKAVDIVNFINSNLETKYRFD